MRFLLDQDVYAATARFLSETGHDIATAANVGMARAEDVEIMAYARDHDRILVTRDRDFGHLALLAEATPGILYLRGRPSTWAAVHKELARVLERYDQDRLSVAFMVIEPGRHRIRGPLSP